MKNPVNRLATACPHALDSILGVKNSSAQDAAPDKKRERSCSFDLDLSGLRLDSSGSLGGGSSVTGGSSVGLSGSSIAEEGSVVTFEELSEFSKELSLGVPSTEGPSPN